MNTSNNHLGMPSSDSTNDAEEENTRNQAEDDRFGLSPEQLELVLDRQAAYKAYPENVLTWDDIKARLKK